MAQTAQPTPVISANAIAAMSASQREQYFQSLDDQNAADARAAYAAYADTARRAFMTMSIRKVAVCPPTSGGTKQNITVGSSLTYDFPTAGGAYCEALIFTVNITIALAAGSSAVYAINDGGILTLFDNIQVLLNGVQHSLRPYILKYIPQLQRYTSYSEPKTVVAGQKSTAVETALNNNGTYSVAAGSVTYTFVFRMPFNVINPMLPAGIIPMQAAGTKPQVVVTCAPNLLGNDPVLNLYRVVSGTGHAVTISSGTLQVDAQYMDGTNLWTPQALSIDLDGVPTIQYIRDQVLTGLSAGTVMRGRITTLLQHYLVLLTLMDGVTAGKFAALSNIAVLELDMDSVGQNKFFQFGTGTNVSIFDWYERFRNTFGIDLDDGVIPWVVGWSNGIANPDNRDAAAMLNMMVGGWTDVNHGTQFTAVGVVYTARVEVHLISLNPAGLKLIQLG